MLSLACLNSCELTVDDGIMMDISPGSLGNNTLGADNGHGYTSNPVTGLPYEGLPLIPDLIERVTVAPVSSGYHADLTSGEIAVFCWPGQPKNPVNETSGAG
ncbi:MAG: hypothetical protein EXS36_08265 [Pedosphaera sp.]|nr:hypothetical protein [Pedosphaera sp.]